MKYSRHHFNEDTCQLWQIGKTLPASPNSIAYVVKYRAGDTKEYSFIEVKAQSIDDALLLTCLLAANESSISPEEVDLHSVYDLKGKLLWSDELPYDVSRREFLAAFGLVNMALLFGFPKIAEGATTSVSLSGSASGLGYVDDVFSTYLYTGNGTTQTINNGIDLAGSGGMVWVKCRDTSGFDHALYSSSVSSTLALCTNNTSSLGSSDFTGFTNTGFSLGFWSGYANQSGKLFCAWTFRKAQKFFDVVSFTATAGNQTISHSLGVTPGMVLIKNTNGTEDWLVYHCTTGKDSYGRISSTNAFSAFASAWGTTGATDSTFTISSSLKTTGQTYVAYLFANDAAADGIIQCGSYSGNGNSVAVGAGQKITLGWEPQFIIIKRSDAIASWYMADNMRGLFGNGAGGLTLSPNSNSSEQVYGSITPNATGFSIDQSDSQINAAGGTYIYLAIRRPNKPPTSGTQVFQAVARTGTGAAPTSVSLPFTPDSVWEFIRTGVYGLYNCDRLRGSNNYLTSTSSAVEASAGGLIGFDASNGFKGTNASWEVSGTMLVNYAFRRAPGFFDIVCYKYASGFPSIVHGLGAVPELIIIKQRTTTLANWAVTTGFTSTTAISLVLNTTAAGFTGLYSDANSYLTQQPTATTFTLRPGQQTSANGENYVAYLFASLPGISKVGTYTGNGTSQTINCGFTTGARMILIKRSDSTGDWYIWDHARGIVAGNDPHLSVNVVTAEVTTDDSVDPDVSGFIVNQNATTNVNVTSGIYVYLAIA